MKALFTLFIIFIMHGSSDAQVFVKFVATGANNGSSWTDAYSNLQSAIDNTPENGQIWVARTKLVFYSQYRFITT